MTSHDHTNRDYCETNKNKRKRKKKKEKRKECIKTKVKTIMILFTTFNDTCTIFSVQVRQ